MRPIFVDQPTYGTIFGVARTIWYMPEMLGTFFQRSARRHGTRHDRGSYALLIGVLTDVIREANYWAAQVGAVVIDAIHIRKALDEKVERASLIQERIRELIVEGTLLIDTTGERVGHVNGLAVIGLSDHSFGRPSRITASAELGREGIVDIEREVKLGGPLHSKGVMILSGYLATPTPRSSRWPSRRGWCSSRATKESMATAPQRPSCMRYSRRSRSCRSSRASP
jgi:hypothetical protein